MMPSVIRRVRSSTALLLGVIEPNLQETGRRHSTRSEHISSTESLHHYFFQLFKRGDDTENVTLYM